MKLKMTDTFRKAAISMIVYFTMAILVFPAYHLVKGDFSWEDTLLFAGLNILTACLLGVFFYFGFKIPTKDEMGE